MFAEKHRPEVGVRVVVDLVVGVALAARDEAVKRPLHVCEEPTLVLVDDNTGGGVRDEDGTEAAVGVVGEFAGHRVGHVHNVESVGCLDLDGHTPRHGREGNESRRRSAGRAWALAGLARPPSNRPVARPVTVRGSNALIRRGVVPDVMRTLAPTRGNLHATERQIHHAERGHDVLRRRLDGLIFELLDVLDRERAVRQRLGEHYGAAQATFDLAWALEGQVGLEGIVRARQAHPELSVTIRNVMGIDVPTVRSSATTSDLLGHGYGLVGSSAAVDETVDAYERLLGDIVAVATVEAELRVLVDEIGRVRRRVAALRRVVLPRLRDRRARIRRGLAERERDELSRLLWFKRRHD